MPIPVSIIMNIRDGAPFLPEALESALAQTFRDWELIVWDDCSTDESAAIVARYRDPRIRYFLSPEATDLGRARENAIGQARGSWLAFLDQDDIWLAEKLERQMAVIESDGNDDLAIVYGRTIAFMPSGRERDFDIVHEFRKLPEGDIFLELFRASCFIAISSALLRRSAVEELGGIPARYGVSCDYFLFTEIARRYRARAVQEVVCRYRLHGSSLSNQSCSRAHQEGIMVVDRWAGPIGHDLASRTRRLYSNAIALAEMSHWRTAARGIRRQVEHGSVMRLLSRPFARAYRRIRRRFNPPPWIVNYRSRKTLEPKLGEIRPKAGAADETVCPTSENTAGWVAQAVSPAISAYVEASPYPLTLSVIVVNWKVCELLRECLNSLYAETQLDRARWEVIVVDNASDDATPEIIAREFPQVRLQVNRVNVGFGKANNQALPSCRGKYILLLNPDTVVLPHAIDLMVAKMDAHADYGALGCRLLNTDGSVQRFTGGNAPRVLNVACFYLFAHRLLPQRLLPAPLFLEDEPKADAPVGWVSGACILLRREALGGQLFNERFFLYGEDLEMCQRLAAAGWKVVYTPDAQIIHHGGRSRDLQSPSLRSRNLMGLREVYTHRAGFSSAWLFDLVMSVAFLIRSVVFGIAAQARRGGGFEARAVASRYLLGEAVRMLFGMHRSQEKN